MSGVRYGDVLKERKFMQNLIANVISRFGDSVDAIAYSWIMYEVTGNASLIAFIVALNYIPTIVFQPFAGVFVERMEKKKVLAFTALGRGAIVLCTMTLYMSGDINSIYLMAATLLTSTLEAFSNPAGTAFITRIIPMEKMVTAKSLSASAGTVAELIGMSLAGTIVAFWGSHTTLFIDAMTFLVSALLILFIPYKEQTEKTALTMGRYKKDFSEGFRYVISNKPLLAIIGIGMSLNMINVPFSSFEAVFVGEYLQLDAQAMSAFGLSMMIGMFLGSVVAPKIGEKLGIRKGIVLSGMLFSPFYVGAAFLPLGSLNGFFVYGVMITGLLIMGFGFGSVSVLFSSVFVKNVEGAYQARVSGITNALLTSMMPAMGLVNSFLAIFLKVNVIFLIVGIVNIFIYLFVSGAKIFCVLDEDGVERHGNLE